MIIYPDTGYNTWNTIEQADAYLSDRLNAEAWDGLTDAQKEKLLIHAFRRINGYVDRDLVPLETLQEAQCEQALYELRFNPDATSDPLSSVSLDGVKADFAWKTLAKLAPDAVMLLRRYRQLPTIERTR